MAIHYPHNPEEEENQNENEFGKTIMAGFVLGVMATLGIIGIIKNL